jgi:hypothetical protein
MKCYFSDLLTYGNFRFQVFAMPLSTPNDKDQLLHPLDPHQLTQPQLQYDNEEQDVDVAGDDDDDPIVTVEPASVCEGCIDEVSGDMEGVLVYGNRDEEGVREEPMNMSVRESEEPQEMPIEDEENKDSVENSDEEEMPGTSEHVDNDIKQTEQRSGEHVEIEQLDARLGPTFHKFTDQHEQTEDRLRLMDVICEF